MLMIGRQMRILTEYDRQGQKDIKLDAQNGIQHSMCGGETLA